MEDLIRRASTLHSASGVARAVLDISRHDDFAMKELVACIEKDPALTARVLSTVNSSRFGLSRHVANLPQAVAILGRQSLRQLALAFSVVEALTKGSDAQVYGDYWRRSLTTSLVASLLAPLDPGTDPNDAYSAGLLADIGVLVLAQLESRRYLPVHRAHVHGPGLIEVEQQVFGFDHTELGARLLEEWQFPPMFALAVAAHHDPDEAAILPLARMVRAGNLMPGAIWNADSETFRTAYHWFEIHYDFTIDRFVDLALETNRAVREQASLYQIEGLEEVACDQIRQEADRHRCALN